MNKLYKISIFLTIFVQYTQQYRQLQIEDDDLCSLIKKRKIKLGKGDKSGLIVKQSRLNDHSSQWNINSLCKFEVDTAHQKEGIFAVIQDLTFRKNETTDECVDYVQFTKKDGSSSRRYCGRFNAALKMDHNFIDPSIAISLGNSFIDEKGEMDVHIFVSKEPLQNDEEMELTIVFTAFKDCLDADKRDELKPCSRQNADFCIYKGFFQDGYVNCPYPDCVDEGGCGDAEITTKMKSSLGNKVLIGSISALFIVFAVFVLCLWACRTYKIFCWANNFANPTTQQQEPNSGTRVMEMDEQVGSRRSREVQGNSSVPSAPIDENKDLPPSYDSLFPSR